MKKMSVKKEILTITLIIIAILAIGSKVLATGTSDSPIQIPTINTNTTPVTDTNTTINTTTNAITPTTNVMAITNTTVSTYQNTALPQTGDASDYAIFMLIVVAAIVAVYAYKKVRDYNI